MDMVENQSDSLPVADIIETLNLLVTPSSSGQKCEEPATDPFLQHLKHNLERVDKRLSDRRFLSLSTALKERIGNTELPGASPSWQYVNYILQLLRLLSQALLKLQTEDAKEHCSSETTTGKGSKPKDPDDAPPLRKTALSMKQITTIKTTLQFVTSLGICPHLASGVGIPLQYRSRAASLFPLDPVSTADTCTSSESNRARLSVCTSALGETVQVEELKSVALSEPFLAHILAALLQQMNEVRGVSQTGSAQSELAQHVTPNIHESKEATSQDSAHAEQRASSSDKSGDSVSSASGSRDCEKRDLVCASHAEDEKIAEDCQKMLSCIVSSANPVLLMRMLMVLQNGIPEKFQKQRNPGSPVIRPPAWLKKHCSQLLFTLSEQPHGILHVFEAISSSAPDRSPSGTWRHCGVVANIIAGKYSVSAKDSDQYLVNVSGQLMDLLHTKGSDADNLGMLVGRVAAAMTMKCDGFHGFHSHLLQPLYLCREGLQGERNGTVVVSEEELTNCVQLMHTVYIRGQQPLPDILSVLTPVMEVVWALFCVTHSGVCIIKQWVKDVVVSYLKWAGREQAALFLAKQGEATLAVRFEPGQQGGLQAIRCDSRGLDDEQYVAAMISVLQELKTEAVAGELLVNLLKGLTEIISIETQHTDVVLPARVQRAEVKEEKTVELKRQVTLLHQIASICETFGSECLTDNSHILLFVKASLERAVAVCRGTTDEETVAFEMSTLSMTLALLSAVMAGALEMKEEDRQLMDSMLPLLEVIGQEHADDFIREMASDTRIAIATRGAVWSSVQQSKKGEKKSRPGKKESAELLEPKKKAATLTCETESSPLLTELSLQKKKKEEGETTKPASQPRRPLIEVLSEHTFSDSEAAEVNLSSSVKKTVSKPLIEELDSHVSEVTVKKDQKSLSSSENGSPSGKNVCEDSSSKADTQEADPPEKQGIDFNKFFLSKDPEESRLQTVFKELCDPLLPVRGHALIALAKLVQEKDPETLSKPDVVQKVFEENLRHGDSYLYLAAINGMSALADCIPESVVPFLAKEFGGFEKSGLNQTAENRLKVGEALMKATKNLGDMTPKYRDLLLRAVLTGARDEDVAVRASSVSNLAEVCALLRFSLGPVLHEVVGCCRDLLQSDEAVVRQAAALTLAKLLEGLGQDCFSVLETVMKDLYGLLKKVCAVDPDDAVRLHANLALDRLDQITRSYLFPKQRLEKKIQVLTDANTFR